jgi:hypothetical protein
MEPNSDPTALSKVALLLGAACAFAATVGLMIVKSGDGDAESQGLARQFIAESLGTPVVAVSILAAALSLWALFTFAVLITRLPPP